jgi:hypothetical protein
MSPLSPYPWEAVPPLTAGLPVISPTNTVAVGSTIQIQESVTGLAPLHYQWRLDSGSGFTNIPSSDVSLLTTGVGAVGSKNYKVVVSDLTGSVTSAPVTLTVTAATSTLVASSTSVENASTIDLSSEGVLDWAYWGLGGPSGFDQRDMVTYPIPGVAGNQITNFIPIGGETYFGFGGADTFTWTNGTPDATGSTTAGIFVAGAGNGFEVDVAATSNERVLNIYVGLFFATMHFEAEMSDNSAPVFIDESFNGTFSIPLRRYSIKYSSPNPGAFLKVRYWMVTGSNVTLTSATLTYGAVNLQVQPVGGGQLQVTWPVGTLLEAPTITGPWTTNSATSPYTFTPTGSQKYFRAIIQ